jgi:hypothetical protein
VTAPFATKADKLTHSCRQKSSAGHFTKDENQDGFCYLFILGLLGVKKIIFLKLQDSSIMPSELAAYADAGQVLKNFGPVSYQ